MTRRLEGFSRILITTVFSVIAACSAASAQTQTSGPAIDLFGASVRSTDSDIDFDYKAYGLRGSFRFTTAWALEGALSRLKEDGDVWFADLSAKAYLVHSNLFEIYALAGPGVFRVSGEDFEKATLHLGIGAEIPLGERAYLRPEVRGRWLADELKADDGLMDYSLGFGWRF